MMAVINAIAFASNSCAACWIFGLFDAGGIPTDGTAINARSASVVADWILPNSSSSGLMLAPYVSVQFVDVGRQTFEGLAIVFPRALEGFHQFPLCIGKGLDYLAIQHARTVATPDHTVPNRPSQCPEEQCTRPGQSPCRASLSVEWASIRKQRTDKRHPHAD
jgi:hypothetical protein